PDDRRCRARALVCGGRRDLSAGAAVSVSLSPQMVLGREREADRRRAASRWHYPPAGPAARELELDPLAVPGAATHHVRQSGVAAREHAELKPAGRWR